MWLLILLQISIWSLVANGELAKTATSSDGTVKPVEASQGGASPCTSGNYIARFEKNGKSLTFVAVTHGMGPEAQSPTFKLIRTAYDRFKPQLNVVEHFNFKEGTSPQARVSEIESCRSTEFRNCPEIYFSAALADQRGVPFIGAEPSHSDLVQSIAPEFSASDYACFHWLTSFDSLRIGGRTGPKDVVEHRTRYTETVRALSGIDYTYEDFLNCYRKKLKSEFNISRLSTEIYRPDPSPHAGFFQRLMHKMDHLRNQSILKTIELGFNNADRVLVVYGNGHLTQNLADLSTKYGPPMYICEDQNR